MISIERDSSGAMTENDGFSVVAATRMTWRVSTPGSSASCWALVNRWISSRNSTVCRSYMSRSRAAASMTARTSLTPAVTARQLDEPAVGRRRDEVGQGRLAGAGRSPDDRATAAPAAPPEPSISRRSGTARAQHVGLAADLVQRARVASARRAAAGRRPTACRRRRGSRAVDGCRANRSSPAPVPTDGRLSPVTDAPDAPPTGTRSAALAARLGHRRAAPGSVVVTWLLARGRRLRGRRRAPSATSRCSTGSSTGEPTVAGENETGPRPARRRRRLGSCRPYTVRVDGVDVAGPGRRAGRHRRRPARSRAIPACRAVAIAVRRARAGSQAPPPRRCSRTARPARTGSSRW